MTENTPSHDLRLTCSRRQALRAAVGTGAAFVLASCQQTTAPARADDGVTVTGDTIVLRLDLVTALRAIDSAYILAEQNVIVVRVAERDYRAFSNICTHAGCGIHAFSNRRFRCQCHGSEFDTDGAAVTGPAVLPLPRYDTTLNGNGSELRVTLARTV